MKRVILLIMGLTFSASIFAYTITDDDGGTFLGFCDNNEVLFTGNYDSSINYAHICAPGRECFAGTSKHQVISKMCDE